MDIIPVRRPNMRMEGGMPDRSKSKNNFKQRRIPPNRNIHYVLIPVRAYEFLCHANRVLNSPRKKLQGHNGLHNEVKAILLSMVTSLIALDGSFCLCYTRFQTIPSSRTGVPPGNNLSNEKILKSNVWNFPSCSMSSATARPAAGDCINPCPEKPLISNIFGNDG